MGGVEEALAMATRHRRRLRSHRVVDIAEVNFTMLEPMRAP